MLCFNFQNQSGYMRDTDFKGALFTEKLHDAWRYQSLQQCVQTLANPGKGTRLFGGLKVLGSRNFVLCSDHGKSARHPGSHADRVQDRRRHDRS
jgi:hypothetical protein